MRNSRLFGLLRRLFKDERGSYLVQMSLMAPILIGIVGLGTEGGLLLYKVQRLQAASDSAAMSAATAYAANSQANLSTQAKAVTAAYGFVDGTNNVTVTVNSPPIAPPSCYSQSAVYSGNNSAIEVVVTQPQPPIFSSIWVKKNYGLCGRSVALVKGAGDGCIIGLDSTASDTVLVNNNATISNSNCKVYSNSSSNSALRCSNNCVIDASTYVVGGDSVGNNGSLNGSQNVTGSSPVADPYASVSPGSAGACTTSSPVTGGSIGPGHYCGGINIWNNGSLNMSSGVYYIDQQFNMKNNVTLNADPPGGVTIIINGNYALGWGNNATINITAQSTGTYAGLALFGPRNSSSSVTQEFSNNVDLHIQGAIYFPSQTVQFDNNSSFDSSLCTQIIGDMVAIYNNGDMASNCPGTGIKGVGARTALVE